MHWLQHAIIRHAGVTAFFIVVFSNLLFCYLTRKCFEIPHGAYSCPLGTIFEKPHKLHFKKNCIFDKNETSMILERTKNEIIVRLPANVDLTELQNMLDYLNYKEQTSKSKVTQKDVDELSETVNQNIWTKFKAQRRMK